MNQTSQPSKTEKCSPYIRHIALVNIVKKTKRTFLSIIAVMISVAIIYTSLNLFLNVYRITKSESTYKQGYYHYILETNVDGSPSRETITEDNNLNLYGTLDSNQINIRSFGNVAKLPFKLSSGSLATDDSSIVVPASLGYKVGDTIELDLAYGQYDSSSIYGFSSSIESDTTKYTYTVCGLYQPSTTYTKTTGDYICFYTDSTSDNEYHTIYAYDNNVQYSDSVTLTATFFGIDENEVILNSGAIDYDTIRNYLKDTTTLLFMFVFIVILAFLISIISLKNVFITSDKDRKKEFGLLKSIGATKKDLKHLLYWELSVLGVIGALLGVILGLAVSFLVIYLFTQRIALDITVSMVANPLLLIFAFIIGFLMILLIGFSSYRPYLHSNPIDDLKENTYNYDPPVHKPSYTAKSFSWKMFLIYNNRLKSQTRNIFYSFTLLITTTILFTAILLSNLFYQIDVGKVEYDYSFSSITTKEVIATNRDFFEGLYDLVDDGTIIPETMYVSHSVDNPDTYIDTDLLTEDGITAYKKNTRVTYEEKGINGTKMSMIYLPSRVLDEHQLEEVEPYIDEQEDNMNLEEGGCILIINDSSESAGGLFENVKVGDTIYFSENRTETIKAIVRFDSEDEFNTKYISLGSFERGIYFDYDYYVNTFGESNINDNINLTLENEATASKATVAIESLISKTNAKCSYENMIEQRKECKIISFILESLLYPLFVMLFIISVININNVLIGNVHLKRGDISILKSVGMSTGQLYGFIIYEYAEGYLNASFVSIGVFIPMCILESVLNLTSSFKLGENIFATTMMSILIIDLLIVAALVALSLRSLKEIDAIENMKNIT